MRYFICDIDDYNKAVDEGVALEEDVRGYAPRYSPDNSEVLVTGYGEMTGDEVTLYISENWIYPSEA